MTLDCVEPIIGDFYRTRPIKRSRRTKAAVEQLDGQILDVLGLDAPQSVRHVFYRMTDPRLPEPVEKSEHGYRHVQDRIVKLRRSGRVPYGWITDATRRGYFTPTYRDKSSFLRSVHSLYRADIWQQAHWYSEVWTESRSIAGVVQDVCEELAISLYPAGGFSSLTLTYDAATQINSIVDGKRVCIFYIGDYDPAGVLIDVSIERELRRHLRPDIELYFYRLGITREQRLSNTTCRRNRARQARGVRPRLSRRSRRKRCPPTYYALFSAIMSNNFCRGAP